MTFWAIFCGNSSYPFDNFGAFFAATINPYSCINHIQVISIDFLFLLSCLFITLKASTTQNFASAFRIFSVAINTGLSLAYLVLGLWILGDKLRDKKTVLPLHGLLVLLSQGFSWLFLGLILSFKRSYNNHFTFVRFCAVFSGFYAAFISVISVYEVVVFRRLKSAKVIINVMLLPGAVLLLFCTFRKHTDDQEIESEESNICFHDSYIALKGDGVDENQTQFSKAGFISRMSFWWLNPLMKKGLEGS